MAYVQSHTQRIAQLQQCNKIMAAITALAVRARKVYNAMERAGTLYSTINTTVQGILDEAEGLIVVLLSTLQLVRWDLKVTAKPVSKYLALPTYYAVEADAGGAHAGEARIASPVSVFNGWLAGDTVEIYDAEDDDNNRNPNTTTKFMTIASVGLAYQDIYLTTALSSDNATDESIRIVLRTR